ncbi:uncharacterized protein LOC126914981 [Bombus affinis]|uniref:uncharacterized protein LOC126914981 n=1 Tax=Bombus affinis TaxID=309941 RepID=UPI0021B83D50|nr:uncharacterized protein LOC126914981 [Bombus affinis]
MDVFYRQYNTYRILLSILGIWPYHKSIYLTIHRISTSFIMLAYIVFQVCRIHYFYALNLCTPRGFIANLLVTNLREDEYVIVILSLFKSGITFRGCIVTLSAICPVMIFFMRYVTSVTMFPVIPVLGLCCSWSLFGVSYVFTPITLDLLLPLNESRECYFSCSTMFSHDRIEYIDIACVNILVVYTIGL